MATRTKIDGAGRLVIPKELRDRYGLEPGTEVEIVPVPDGITLVPARTEHRVVRQGRVVAIDTGARTAPASLFDVERLRSEHLERKGGASR